jgi:hypothetical protein
MLSQTRYRHLLVEASQIDATVTLLIHIADSCRIAVNPLSRLSAKA